ncbi:MAG: hypothetical protein WCR21_12610, partial [Bacteroidota bacterium]
LKGDQYSFDEENYRYVGRNSNKIYALGDTVKITLMDADLMKKQLNYAFADMAQSNTKSNFTGKRGSRKNEEKMPEPSKTKFVDHKRRRGR